jgi:hypothetical protein
MQVYLDAHSTECGEREREKKDFETLPSSTFIPHFLLKGLCSVLNFWI